MEQNITSRTKRYVRNGQQNSLRSPVITNNTELDSLLSLLPLLLAIREGKETLSQASALTLAKEVEGKQKNIVVTILLPFLIKSSKLNLIEAQNHIQSSWIPFSFSIITSSMIGAIGSAFGLFFSRRGFSNRELMLISGAVLVSSFVLLQGPEQYEKNNKKKTQSQFSFVQPNLIVNDALIEQISHSFQDMASTLKVASYNHSRRYDVKDVCAKLKPLQSLLALALLDLGIPYEKVNSILAPLFNQIQLILNPPKPYEPADINLFKGYYPNILNRHTSPSPSSLYSKDDEEYFSPDESVEEEEEEEKDHQFTTLSSQPLLPFSSASILPKSELEVIEQEEGDLTSSLEDKAVRILTTQGIHAYKIRLNLSGCLTEDDFRFHTYWIRNSFVELVRDESLRKEFSESGKELTVGLLEIVGGGVDEFTFAYDDFLDFLTNNLESAIRDVERLPVRYLNIWDIFVEYTIMDAFDVLVSLPSSLTSVLQWTPQSAKFALVQRFVVQNLDDKIKQAQIDNIPFREKYLMALKHIGPWLMLGFLNSDKKISSLFVKFKDIFLEFYRNLFALNLRTMKTPKEHREHVLRLSRKLIEDAISLTS